MEGRRGMGKGRRKFLRGGKRRGGSRKRVGK
jgi:hypothetical protein